MLSVYYLDHSGFLIDTGRCLLLFDYCNEEPSGGGLSQGVFRPGDWSQRKVYVFVSHRHKDHYNPSIWNFRDCISDITYILSDDIDAQANAVVLSPHKTYQDGLVTVKTLTSTDEGLAFLVETDGMRIYHAGDLNWWHWEEESIEYNLEMSEHYRREIDTLKDAGHIDVAFVPVDPRLGQAYLYGISYLMNTLEVTAAVPMHFWEDFAVFDSIKNDEKAKNYLQKVCAFRKRGDRILLKWENVQNM